MLSKQLRRSYLFAPANRPELLVKALHRGADAVVVDLEDSVGVEDKERARHLADSFLGKEAATSPVPVHVRVNRQGDGYDPADVRIAIQPSVSGLRLPKAESPDALEQLASDVADLERAAGLEPGRIAFYPAVESVAGLDACRALARASGRVVALVFGSADFLADIGASQTDDAAASLLARSTLVYTSRSSGLLPPIDGAYPALDDSAGLRRSAEHARDLGFFGKSAIHPAQLAVVHDVFTPSADELTRAARFVAAAGSGEGGSVVDGQFVDAPVAARARALLDLAEGLDLHVH